MTLTAYVQFLTLRALAHHIFHLALDQGAMILSRHIGNDLPEKETVSKPTLPLSLSLLLLTILVV